MQLKRTSLHLLQATLDKFDSVAPVNLLIKGKKADKIVVKNCDVDAKATAKANQ